MVNTTAIGIIIGAGFLAGAVAIGYAVYCIRRESKHITTEQWGDTTIINTDAHRIRITNQEERNVTP